jgi:peptidoglycan-N-acetylglucosamine deacetylase
MLALLILLASTFTVEAKEIALTFDDSPRFATGYFDGPTRATKLIATLKKAKVKEAAFFSVSSSLNPEGRNRLMAYANAGHIIANHTHTHPNFNETSYTSYIQDFKTADSMLSGFANYEKWFRFPYLREGNELGKRDAMRTALAEAGYKNAYITSNNYDWYMETIFQREIEKNPKLNFEKLKNFYVSTLLKAVEHYDEMAIKHLGRSPKHVMLLHETDLNALFIFDLVIALEAKGWKIISPHEAYTDDIANYITSSLFTGNPGRVGEIARDRGDRNGLWHETCDESYLEREFQRQVLL